MCRDGRTLGGMPEGDTIHRTATALRPVLVGKALTRVEVPRHRPLPAIGATVTSIEARGKHLLFHTSDDLVVHTHLRMTGSWHVYRPGQRWQKSPRAARVVLGVRGAVVVCFAAPVVEVLDAGALRRHPALRRLGPDLCDPGVHLDDVVVRLARQDPARPIGEVLLDQTIASGIGNVYRCDVAFLHELDPRTPPWARSGPTSVARCSPPRRASCRTTWRQGRGPRSPARPTARCGSMAAPASRAGAAVPRSSRAISANHNAWCTGARTVSRPAAPACRKPPGLLASLLP